MPRQKQEINPKSAERLSEWIKAVKIATGLTQAAIAEMLFIKPEYLSALASTTSASARQKRLTADLAQSVAELPIKNKWPEDTHVRRDYLLGLDDFRTEEEYDLNLRAAKAREIIAEINTVNKNNKIVDDYFMLEARTADWIPKKQIEILQRPAEKPITNDNHLQQIRFHEVLYHLTEGRPSPGRDAVTVTFTEEEIADIIFEIELATRGIIDAHARIACRKQHPELSHHTKIEYRFGFDESASFQEGHIVTTDAAGNVISEKHTTE